jgi:hypothetical protein
LCKKVLIPKPTPFFEASADASERDKFSASNALQKIFSAAREETYGSGDSENSLERAETALSSLL